MVYTAWLISGTYLAPNHKECMLTFRYVGVATSSFFFFFLFYFMPLSFMVTLYPIIGCRLSQSISVHTVDANKRITRLLAVSTIAFSVLWAPLMVNSLWLNVHSHSWVTFMLKFKSFFYIYVLSVFFLGVYSTVNTCLYIMLTRPMREPILLQVSRGKEELRAISSGLNSRWNLSSFLVAAENSVAAADSAGREGIASREHQPGSVQVEAQPHFETLC